MKPRKLLLIALAAAALASCASDRSLDNGVIAGEVHPGPSVPYVEAPEGTVIITSDGTKLERTYSTWVVSTSAGVVPARNAFWWDDPRPYAAGVHPIETPADLAEKLKAFSSLTPGLEITVHENGNDMTAGAEGVWTVLGAEHVQVPAGEFESVHIRRYDRSNCFQCGRTALQIVQDLWFVPSVGLVKFSSVILTGIAPGTRDEWSAVKITHG